MKAILRAGAVFMAAALAGAPVTALAQTQPTPTPAPAPTSNSTTSVPVGPSELQNFSLKGTVTRQADQPLVPTPSRPQTAPVRPPALAPSLSRPPQSRTSDRTAAPTGTAPQTATTTGQTVAPNLSAPPVETQPAPVAQQPAGVPSAPPPEPVSAPANPFGRLPLWPWIAAALALAGGVGLLLWRRRQREPLAEIGQFDLRVNERPQPELTPRAPEPAKAPPVAAPPPQAPAAGPSGTITARTPGPKGIVASRLRPALELAFHPLRCQVDDDQVAIEFELEVFNAGAAPARAVFAEASLLNASATQDTELAAFFANANGKGERLEVIQPMKRVSFRSQVVAPRAAVQEYELAGRKAFVPVIAFNTLYEWSGGKAQSSAAYLVGRDTQKEKLGPLRLDHGAREFSGLGARPLPSGVRT